MSYFLFSPPDFLGKYIQHIYCPVNSMGFSYWVERGNNYYMLHYFLLIFPTRFEGVLATYQTPISSHFSHRVFRGDFLKLMMMNILKEQHTRMSLYQDDAHSQNKHRLGGVLRINYNPNNFCLINYHLNIATIMRLLLWGDVSPLPLHLNRHDPLLVSLVTIYITSSSINRDTWFIYISMILSLSWFLLK